MSRKKKKNKLRGAVVILILTCLAGMGVYYMRFSWGLSAPAVHTLLRLEQPEGRMSFHGRYGSLLAVSSEGIRCISPAGKTQWTVTRRLINPVLSSEGDFLLLYDKEAKEIAAYDRDRLLWERKTEYPIITAKINAEGYTALATYAVGYKSRIDIISQKGEDVYLWQVGEGYVVDADVAPGSKSFAVAMIAENASALTSRVSVVDMGLEKVSGEVVREDSLLVQVKYRAGGHLTAVGEGELLGITAKGSLAWSVDFAGRALERFLLPYDGSSILAFEGARSNSVLEMYGKNGVKTGTYTTEEALKGLDTLGNTIVAAEKRRLVFLNLKGRLRARRDMQMDVQGAVLLSGGAAAAVGATTVEAVTP